MASERFKKYLDRPISEIDVAALLSDVADLERDIEREDEKLEAQRTIVAELKDDLAAIYGLRNAIVHFGARGAGKMHATVQRSVNGAPRRRGNKRAAILDLLEDGRARPTTAIRDALVARGVMDDSGNDYHSLQVTLSRMKR